MKNIEVPMVFASSGDTPYSVLFGNNVFGVPEWTDRGWVVEDPRTEAEYLLWLPDGPNQAWQLIAVAEGE